MLDYQYSYFVGALIFVACWAALYIFARTHRAQMLWGSLVAAPFALTGFLFIPEYWSPPSLFNWAQRYGICIEDVIWSAAVGGIASSVAEIFFHQQLENVQPGAATRRYGPLVIMIVVFVALEIARPGESIYNMIISFAAGASLIAIARRDLIPGMLLGATVFAVVYLLLFAWFLVLYDHFIERYYNTTKLLGIYVLGVPLEEILFAFSGGAVWTVFYEYVHTYRLVSAVPPRFAIASSAGNARPRDRAAGL